MMVSSERYWIVLPHQVKRLVRRLPHQEVPWAYLGTDRSRRDHVRRYLGQTHLLPLGAELDGIALEIKPAFLTWMHQIGVRQRDQRNWWASRMASRSPFQTTLFLLVCYAELISRWMTRADPTGARVVVVEDPWLWWVLRKRYARHRQAVFLTSGWIAIVAEVSSRLARVPGAVGRFLIWSLSTVLSARWSIPERHGKGETTGRRTVLLYTWLEPRYFSAPNGLRDPWTGRLCEVLTAQGERVWRLTPLQVGVQQDWLPRLRDSTVPVIVSPRYLRLIDLASSLGKWFTINYLRQMSRFQEWDCAPLLYRELLREWGEFEFMGYQLWYRAMCRVARCEARHLTCLIYPFENQPWEKLLCLAFQREAPEVQLIGYQHSSFSPLMLNYYLADGETSFVPLPHRIVANGALALEQFRSGGFPPERLSNGGALRFEYLFATPPSRELRPASESPARRIVVALPFVAHAARSLLLDLIQQFPTPVLRELDEAPVEFVVKCHPMFPMEKFLCPSGRLPSWMRVSEQPLTELFAMAEIFLYVPPSTTSLEAYLMGLTVLRYSDGAFQKDAIDALGSAVIHSCSWQTLRAQVVALLKESRHVAADRELRREALRQVFSPVDETAWLTLTRMS